MKLELVGRVCGGAAVALLLGACQVEVGTMSSPPPPPAGGHPVAVAREARPRPAPPAPANHPAVQLRPGASIAHAVAPPPAPRARLYVPPPPPAPAPVSLRFPARIVHPLPMSNPGASHLDVAHIILRPGRKCGPYQLAGGHWVHLDCNLHAPITIARPAALMARKLALFRRGILRVESAVRGTSLPEAVDHRIDGTEGPIKDQGQVGSCTAFSLSSAMDNAIRRQNKGDTMSSLHIWSRYGFPAMRSAGDSTVGKSIADWAVWPYDERVACELDRSGEPGDCGPYSPPVTQGGGASDPQVQAAEKSADGNAQWKVTEYDAVPTDPDSLAAVIATGDDVWFSMDIGNSWMNPSGDAIADWNDASIDGGHAVLLAGYRVSNGQRQFLVHNSWGKDWGDNGFAYISEAMVRAYMRSAYKVVVASTVAPPPPPSDPNALTDDDCAADQLVDSVTGQCAVMCPDDSRPANGQCDGGSAGARKPPAGARL